MPGRFKPWIGFFAVLFCVNSWASSPARAEALSSVFSMNLHCALGNWQARVDEIVDELVRTKPQVMAFQEVCHNKKIDMARYLVDRLVASGVPVSFWKTVDTHPSFFKYQEELLLVSTLPVQAHEHGKLPSLIFFRNNYLAFQIDGTWVVTTHLHFLFSFIRKSQFKKLTKLFGGRPVLMMGDFNTGPNSSESKPFRKAGWLSIFDGPTFPAEKPKDVFDGFWFSDDLKKRVQGASMRKVFEKASQEHEPPSDHLGVALTFSLSD